MCAIPSFVHSPLPVAGSSQHLTFSLSGDRQPARDQPFVTDRDLGKIWMIRGGSSSVLWSVDKVRCVTANTCLIWIPLIWPRCTGWLPHVPPALGSKLPSRNYYNWRGGGEHVTRHLRGTCSSPTHLWPDHAIAPIGHLNPSPPPRRQQVESECMLGPCDRSLASGTKCSISLGSTI